MAGDDGGERRSVDMGMGIGFVGGAGEEVCLVGGVLMREGH